MRKPLIAGNWKMHGARAQVRELLQGIVAGHEVVTETAELAVFPPFPFLADCEQILNGFKVAWGAQNVHHEESGAFTGEVAAKMLTDFACQYVIVGHSERRQLFGETNAIVAKKFLAVQKAGLMPILCVGETLGEREAGQTLQIVQQQLASVLDMVDNIDALQKAVVAYEPVWAIGTGKQASPEQAQEVHAAIRAQLADFNSEAAQKIRLLYGGSVKAGNAAGLLAMTDIDGALVGGASLDAHSFLEIAKQCKH